MNYKHIRATLKKENRSLSINFKNEYINSELLTELKHIVSWLLPKTEIYSLLIVPSNKNFNPNDIIKLTSTEFSLLQSNILEIAYSFYFLPQTIIFDLQSGVSDQMLELSCAGDIRICQEDASFQFQHLLKGQTPSSGGISLLSTFIELSKIKYWILSSKKINAQELSMINEIYKNKEKEETITKLIQQIYRQSPLARIQTKKSFLEKALPELSRGLKYAPKISNASNCYEDWKVPFQKLTDQLSSESFTDIKNIKNPENNITN